MKILLQKFVDVLALVGVVIGFNLENREPIIKRSFDGTYFGYSVAQHKIQQNIFNHTNNWLLIGAPLGKNLQPGTNRSGALYKCPMTYFDNDCIQVPTDGRRSEDDMELYPPRSDEIKEDQWMGVTVRSQGPEGMVLVCAHRYILAVRESRFGQGLCYTLTHELEYENAYEPCKGRPTNKEHQQFGYCQAGTSGALLADGTAIFGSPGPFTWRGTLFVHAVDGDFLSRDKTMYMGPLNDTPDPVDKYSYLGMSVTGGNYFGDKIVFASGAPRSNGTGQVFIFSKKPFENIMNVTMKLNGDQFASSFGYEVATADINGDKTADLIVGAPFYFSRNEGGAVYIYTNLNRSDSDCKPSMKLTGPLESRFGFAISTLGDTNKDGYDDIAIGAPYDGDGAVYIYLGSKNGLIREPSQILRPLNTGIKTLGYSLSGGLDMDENGYPDLLVGAYESDAVILFRGRIIIDLETDITGPGLKKIDPSKQKCDTDPRSNTTCFAFTVCCKLKPQIKNPKLTAQTLLYKIEAETFSGERKFSRVYFKSDNDKRNIINRKITINGNKNKHCIEETVYLNEGTSDILSPIKFRLNYTLGDDKPNKEILNKQESEKVFIATFQKDCGDNDECESNLRLDAKLLLQEEKENEFILMLGEEEEVKLVVNVTNIGEPAYETQLFINHPSSLSYIALGKSSNIVCNYRGETLVVCSLGNPFKTDNRANALLRFEPKHLGKSEGKLKFRIHVNSTSKELSSKTTAALTATVVKHAEVGITGSATSNVLYGGEIKGESAMRYLDDVGSRVIHKYQVANNGPWKIEYLEVHIEWPFQVGNNKPLGKWLLYLEERPIIDGGETCKMLPDMVNPLNLIVKPGLLEQPIDNEIIPSYPDPPYNMTTTRRKRDTEMIIIPIQHIDRDGHKRQVIDMNCQNGTAKCLKFYCTIRNLEKNSEATIKIKARLWNSTLVEDYPRIDWVRISSSARIYIPAEYSIEQNTSNDEAIAETLAYPDLLEQEAKPAPLWIIIVAAVAGILLLILLTLVLWKLGFFKRQRLDPTLSGNLEKHSREEQPFLS